MALSLPGDILLVMLTHLDLEDLLNFRKVKSRTQSRYLFTLKPLCISKTCKDFYELSKSRSTWDSLLRRCIIEEGIPLPGLAGRSLESLSAGELEGLHRRALQLHRNWHSDSPVIRQSLKLVSSVSPIIRMVVLPGRNGGRWLVSLMRTFGHRSSTVTIRCWDLRQTHPVCVAHKDFERFGGMAVNKTTNETDCIAVLTPR